MGTRSLFTGKSNEKGPGTFELLETAQNFVAVSPRSEVRLVVTSRTQEAELRRELAKLAGDKKQNGISIVQSRDLERSGWGVYIQPDLVITAEPLAVVNREKKVSAFDAATFANGGSASKIPSAEFLSAGIAWLLDEHVNWLIRNEDNIIRFKDEDSATDSYLFARVLAVRARAELRTRSAA